MPPAFNLSQDQTLQFEPFKVSLNRRWPHPPPRSPTLDKPTNPRGTRQSTKAPQRLTTPKETQHPFASREQLLIPTPQRDFPATLPAGHEHTQGTPRTPVPTLIGCLLLKIGPLGNRLARFTRNEEAAKRVNYKVRGVRLQPGASKIFRKCAPKS